MARGFHVRWAGLEGPEDIALDQRELSADLRLLAAVRGGTAAEKVSKVKECGPGGAKVAWVNHACRGTQIDVLLRAATQAQSPRLITIHKSQSADSLSLLLSHQLPGKIHALTLDAPKFDFVGDAYSAMSAVAETALFVVDAAMDLAIITTRFAAEDLPSASTAYQPPDRPDADSDRNGHAPRPLAPRLSSNHSNGFRRGILWHH